MSLSLFLFLFNKRVESQFGFKILILKFLQYINIRLIPFQDVLKP